MSINFKDVPAGSWMAAPVEWAIRNQLLKEIDFCYSTDSYGIEQEYLYFGPFQALTRSALYLMIWKAMGTPEPIEDEETVFPFIDVNDDNEQMIKAIKWALENEITFGTSSDTFAPFNMISRGETLTALFRLCGNPLDINEICDSTDITDLTTLDNWLISNLNEGLWTFTDVADFNNIYQRYQDNKTVYDTWYQDAYPDWDESYSTYLSWLINTENLKYYINGEEVLITNNDINTINFHGTQAYIIDNNNEIDITILLNNKVLLLPENIDNIITFLGNYSQESANIYDKWAAIRLLYRTYINDNPYFLLPAIWAIQKDILFGITEDLQNLKLDSACTRAEAAAFFYRIYGHKKNMIYTSTIEEESTP